MCNAVRVAIAKLDCATHLTWDRETKQTRHDLDHSLRLSPMILGVRTVPVRFGKWARHVDQLYRCAPVHCGPSHDASSTRAKRVCSIMQAAHPTTIAACILSSAAEQYTTAAASPAGEPHALPHLATVHKQTMPLRDNRAHAPNEHLENPKAHSRLHCDLRLFHACQRPCPDGLRPSSVGKSLRAHARNMVSFSRTYSRSRSLADFGVCPIQLAR